MQDNQLHGNLTVQEAMKVAANLKLGRHVNKAEKEEVVRKQVSTFISYLFLFSPFFANIILFSIYYVPLWVLNN